MKKKPKITAVRMVKIFNEMMSLRRGYCDDGKFFRMSDFWEWLAGDEGETKIKTYRAREGEELRLKAGVRVFHHAITLTVDERLFSNAKAGCWFSNSVLGHEVGHLGLNHHKFGKIVNNFQLFDGPKGLSNSPPTVEELEANFAGTFFQCGVALLDDRYDALYLARRAFCEVSLVKKALEEVRSLEFQLQLKLEFKRQESCKKPPREIL